jgi:hypothetical protein
VGIKSPQTYGEFYWSMQVEADKLFDEGLEALYAPYFKSIFAGIPALSELPSGFQQLLNALASPHSVGMGGFALGVATASGKDAIDIALAPMMAIISRKINASAREKWLTSTEANLLFSRKKITEEFWASVLASEGYADVLGGMLYRSQIPYPTIPDLIMYCRYTGDADNVWSTIQEFYNIDSVDFKVWEWLGLQRLSTDQLQTLFHRGKLNDYENATALAQIGWDKFDRSQISELGWQIPNAMLMIQGGLMENIPVEQLLKDIQIADIHPEYSLRYLDAVLTKPATDDVINYQLRQDPTLSGLDGELRKIGIHPNYTTLYKELAYMIPPIGDIITMAVREAFTPDIAAKFGQYEDFPEPFTEWAAKKGLSKEWAERYWAAHWTLPSPTQGFEMFHRKVINRDELNMLLRALDIMPFWRDKLTQIAYLPLNRVDIRRMYTIGVLNEGAVEKAYGDIGYDETNARLLKEFTIKQTLQTQSKFGSTNVIAAYVDRKITGAEASSILSDLGIRSNDISVILRNADYKKQWDFVDIQIRAVRNLYKKKIIKENAARADLSAIPIPSEQVDQLIKQWYYETKEEEPKLWTTAQTITFLKKGLISQDRARQELETLGYDSEHIRVYLQGVISA